jgi:hypothetical protein
MKLMTKLIVLGSVVAGAIYLDRRRRLRSGDVEMEIAEELDELADYQDLADVEDLMVVAVTSGIADVDPEALSQVAGEGIDQDANEAAHEDLQDLRERLPRQNF